MSLDQEHYNCLFLRLSGEQKSKYKIGDRDCISKQQLINMAKSAAQEPAVTSQDTFYNQAITQLIRLITFSSKLTAECQLKCSLFP